MLQKHDESGTHLIVDDDAFDNGLVEHLPVPVLQALRLRDFHVSRVTVEDVIVSLAGWTCPDVSHCVATATHTFTRVDQ